MNYASIPDFKMRLGKSIFSEIYPDEEAESAASSDIESAEAEIDGAVGCRYATPISSEKCAALLRDWALTLAEERAFSRAAGSMFSEKIKERCALVRKYLEMIRNGTFQLPGARENRESSVAFASVRKPVFGRENMKGF